MYIRIVEAVLVVYKDTFNLHSVLNSYFYVIQFALNFNSAFPSIVNLIEFCFIFSRDWFFNAMHICLLHVLIKVNQEINQ